MTRRTRKFVAFSLTFTLGLPAIAQSPLSTPVGESQGIDTMGYVIRKGSEGVAEAAEISVPGFVLLVHVPAATTDEGRAALHRVGVTYEQRYQELEGASFYDNAVLAGQAVYEERFFEGKPLVVTALAEDRADSDSYRIVQLVGVGNFRNSPELSTTGPQSAARDAATVLEQWYRTLEAQLGSWESESSYRTWRAEAVQYGALSADPRASELIERGEVYFQAGGGFERCVATWGPKSDSPNEKKCDRCCESAHSECVATVTATAIAGGTVGCVVAGAACASNPVSLVATAGCCAAAAAAVGKLVQWAGVTLLCDPPRNRCLENCAP